MKLRSLSPMWAEHVTEPSLSSIVASFVDVVGPKDLPLEAHRWIGPGPAEIQTILDQL
jgi:hypothetical protein